MRHDVGPSVFTLLPGKAPDTSTDLTLIKAPTELYGSMPELSAPTLWASQG